MSERESIMKKREIRRAREKRRMQKRMIRLCTFVALIAGCSIFFGGIMHTSANSGYKYYKSITVMSGQTLWDIADEYADEHYKNKNHYIKEVIGINHLNYDGNIYSGQTIVIPYYSMEYVF